MGRWSDRRAAKRARKMGNYLGDYYRQADQGTGGTTSPYQVEVPPPPGTAPTRRRRRSKQRPGTEYGFPTWVSQPGPSSTPASTPVPASTPAGPAATGQTVSAGPTSGRTGPSSGGHARRWILGGTAGAAVLIAVIVIAIAAVPRGPDVTDRDHPEFQTVWHTQIDDLDPDATGYPALAPIDTADHLSTPQQMITTDDAWVMVAQDDEHRALIALDPTDGSLAWSHDLPEVQCSHRTGAHDTLVCLAADTRGGQGWTGYVFDAATGAELESWDAPITGSWALHLSDAGLAVVAESEANTYDRLVLLDITDGSEIWSSDLSVIDDDFLFSTREDDGVEVTYLRGIDWAGQGERIMMSTSTTLIQVEAESGEFTHQDCYPFVNTGEMLGCSHHRESVMYDASGAPLWSSDRVQLARPAYRGEHVLVNTADQSVHHTDWDSGYIGAAVHSIGPATIATGSVDHPFLMDEDELLALAPDGSQVRWTLEVRGMNSITDVWVIDDLALVAGASTLALDLASGEEVWHRYSSGDMHVVDGQIVVTGRREVSLLQMP